MIESDSQPMALWSGCSIPECLVCYAPTPKRHSNKTSSFPRYSLLVDYNLYRESMTSFQPLLVSDIHMITEAYL